MSLSKAEIDLLLDLDKLYDRFNNLSFLPERNNHATKKEAYTHIRMLQRIILANAGSEEFLNIIRNRDK